MRLKSSLPQVFARIYSQFSKYYFKLYHECFTSYMYSSPAPVYAVLPSAVIAIDSGPEKFVGNSFNFPSMFTEEIFGKFTLKDKNLLYVSDREFVVLCVEVT